MEFLKARRVWLGLTVAILVAGACFIKGGFLKSNSMLGEAKPNFATSIKEFAPGSPIYNQASIEHILGPPDKGKWADVLGSIGHFGTVTVGFGSKVIVDGSGDDIRLWFGGFDDDNEILEGFRVKGSRGGENFNKIAEIPKRKTLSPPVPLTSIGIDLAGKGLTKIRFLKIIDTGTDKARRGLELNAIEAVNIAGKFVEEIKDEEGNEIGLTVKINYPTNLEVGETGRILVELLTSDAKEATRPDHEHNIQPGVIKLGTDEKLRKEGEAKLWIDPTEGATLKPYNQYYLYEKLVSGDKTNALILEGGVEVLKALPLSGTLLGAYDILKWDPTAVEEKANYEIGGLPSSEIFTNENDYDQWVYGWTFNYYKTACVSGNRVKLSFPFSYEQGGRHPVGIYINVKFEEKDPIVAPLVEPIRIGYEKEFEITVS